MELDGARILVAGATGEIGSLITGELRGRGARLALAGRDEERLGHLSQAEPTITFDARDRATCRAAAHEAHAVLGGLDGLVIAIGAVAFGPAGELPDAIADEVHAVNVLGPTALIATALPLLADDGGILALSAIVADHPTAGMAAYSASKAALSAYLTAVRRENRRRGLTVLDVRPPHLDTTFSERALAGGPPALPAPHSAAEVVALSIDALAAGRREIAWDLGEKHLVAH